MRFFQQSRLVLLQGIAVHSLQDPLVRGVVDVRAADALEHLYLVQLHPLTFDNLLVQDVLRHRVRFILLCVLRRLVDLVLLVLGLQRLFVDQLPVLVN